MLRNFKTADVRIQQTNFWLPLATLECPNFVPSVGRQMAPALPFLGSGMIAGRIQRDWQASDNNNMEPVARPDDDDDGAFCTEFL